MNELKTYVHSACKHKIQASKHTINGDYVIVIHVRSLASQSIDNHNFQANVCVCVRHVHAACEIQYRLKKKNQLKAKREMRFQMCFGVCVYCFQSGLNAISNGITHIKKEEKEKRVSNGGFFLTVQIKLITWATGHLSLFCFCIVFDIFRRCLFCSKMYGISAHQFDTLASNAFYIS